MENSTDKKSVEKEITIFQSKIPKIFSELELSFEMHGFKSKVSGLGLYEFLIGLRSKPSHSNLFLESRCNDPSIIKEIIGAYGDVKSIKTKIISQDVILVMFIEDSSGKIITIRANRGNDEMVGDILAENVCMSPTTGEIFASGRSLSSFDKQEIDAIDEEISSHAGVSGFMFAAELGFAVTENFYNIICGNEFTDMLFKISKRDLSMIAKSSRYPMMGYEYLNLFGVCK